MIHADLRVIMFPTEVTAKFLNMARGHMVFACRALKKLIKANLTTPYPPPSAPFELPHRRSGALRAAINYKTRIYPTGVLGIVYIHSSRATIRRRPWRYGTALETGYHHWKGGKFIPPRPFMWRTFLENKYLMLGYLTLGRLSRIPRLSFVGV